MSAGWSHSGGSRHIFRNAAGEVRAMIRWTPTQGWLGCTASRGGWSQPATLAGPGSSTSRARELMEQRLAMMPPTAREREYLALAVASPCRAPALAAAMPQADAAHLPLFVAANEPRLI